MKERIKRKLASYGYNNEKDMIEAIRNQKDIDVSIFSIFEVDEKVQIEEEIA